MSTFVSAVDAFGATRPDTVAFANSRGEAITYGELKRASDALAGYLLNADAEKRPVVVYGHKSPLMMACFHACSKSGRASVQFDIVYPELRVADIMDQLGTPLVLNTTERDLSAFGDHMGGCVSLDELRAIIDGAGEAPAVPDPSRAVAGLDVFYILFTSGSTGRPKGVEVMAECVDLNILGLGFEESVCEGCCVCRRSLRSACSSCLYCACGIDFLSNYMSRVILAYRSCCALACIRRPCVCRRTPLMGNNHFKPESVA